MQWLRVITLKETTLYSSWKRRQCVNKCAENGSCREEKKTSGHVNAAWRLNECAGMWGDRIPWWRGEPSGSRCEGHAAKPFKAPQWQNLKKQPPVPKSNWLKAKHIHRHWRDRRQDFFKRAFIHRVWGWRTFLCLIPESLSSQAARLEGKWGNEKGTEHLGADSQHCILLGRNEMRGSNLLHPALLKWGNWPCAQ